MTVVKSKLPKTVHFDKAVPMYIYLVKPLKSRQKYTKSEWGSAQMNFSPCSTALSHVRDLLNALLPPDAPLVPESRHPTAVHCNVYFVDLRQI